MSFASTDHVNIINSNYFTEMTRSFKPVSLIQNRASFDILKAKIDGLFTPELTLTFPWELGFYSI